MVVKKLVLVGALAAGLAHQAAAAPSRVLVSFQQTGGFVAIERTVTVRTSGKVVADGAAVSTLSRARLAALRDALADARWRTLRSHYAPDVRVADGFLYAITYAGRTIRIDQGAKVPPRLARPFLILQRLAGLRQ